MGKVVGVRFKPSGKAYDFDAGGLVLEQGEKVVVETEQGLGFGTVVRPPQAVMEEALAKPLKKVHRRATHEDFIQADRILALEKEAHDFCETSIGELGLAMNLFSVDGTFEGSKLTFFFTAEGRVDFRELVKVLVRQFRTRIELRQIGVRHQAKMCGGMGRCGREICCTTFLSNFVPVSVKMAKVQNLSLNPTKISGLCGRLMCCLTFENEVYEELRGSLPKCGKTVETPSGQGKVIRHNVLKNRVAVRLFDGNEIEITPGEVKVVTPPPQQPKKPDAKAENAGQAGGAKKPPERKKRRKKKSRSRQGQNKPKTET